MGTLGYYADADDNHGLLLLGARYYRPSVGRFITLDPITDGPNWYVYVENRPLVAADPTGLSLRKRYCHIKYRVCLATRRGVAKAQYRVCKFLCHQQFGPRGDPTMPPLPPVTGNPGYDDWSWQRWFDKMKGCEKAYNEQWQWWGDDCLDEELRKELARCLKDCDDKFMRRMVGAHKDCLDAYCRCAKHQY